MPSWLCTAVSTPAPCQLQSHPVVLALPFIAGPKQLYTVLEQQKANVGAGTLMGSEHTYVIPGAGGAAGKEKLSIAAQVGAGVGGLSLFRTQQRTALGMA